MTVPEEIPPLGVGSSPRELNGFIVRAAYQEHHIEDPEAQAPRCNTGQLRRRVVILGLGIVTFIATVGVCYSKFLSRRGMYVTGSHPGFVNYDSLAVDSSIDAPGLCNETVVRRACLHMLAESQKIRSTFSLTVDQLSRLLFASKSSVGQFLSGLSLENDFETTGVQCQELCEAVVASFPPKRLPRAVDVGCVELTGLPSPVCNIDLSRESLKHVVFKGISHGRHPWEVSHNGSHGATPAVNVRRLGAARGNAVDKDGTLDGSSSSIDARQLHPDVSTTALQYAIANRFHIFPLATKRSQAPSRTLQETITRAEGEEPCEGIFISDRDRTFQGREHGPWKIGDVWVFGAYDDGWFKMSAVNQDGVFSSDMDRHSKTSITEFMSDSEREAVWNDAIRGRSSWFSTYEVVVTNFCVPGQSAQTPPPPASTSVTGDSRIDSANMIAQISKGVCVKTLEALAAIETNSNIDGVFRKWYGISDGLTTGEIRRNLGGMINLFNDVNFVPDGSECQSSFYAYVITYPPFDQNTDGEYIIHLCSTFHTSDENEQIETVVHEASHHGPMYTADSEYAGESLYGGEKCQNAAKACGSTNNPASAPCTATRKNADSLAFFVADANDRYDEDEEDDFVESISKQVDELADQIGVSPTVLFIGGSVVLCGTCCFCSIILWNMCKIAKKYDRGYSER